MPHMNTNGHTHAHMHASAQFTAYLDETNPSPALLHW